MFLVLESLGARVPCTLFSGYTSAQAGGGANKASKPSRPSSVLSSGGIWVSRRLESWPAIFKVPTRIAFNKEVQALLEKYLK